MIIKIIKTMNWKELKKFCNSLPEKELGKTVILWREDEAISQIVVEQINEDQLTTINQKQLRNLKKEIMKNNKMIYKIGAVNEIYGSEKGICCTNNLLIL